LQALLLLLLLPSFAWLLLLLLMLRGLWPRLLHHQLLPMLRLLAT
jgi:hypothetical protein